MSDSVKHSRNHTEKYTEMHAYRKILDMQNMCAMNR